LATSGIALFSLTYAFVEANQYGWGSGRILGAFAVAAVMVVAFLVLEARQRAPMLDLSLFKNRTFSGANGAMLFVGLAMFGTFFYVSLYMQNVLHYSPVQTGASFLPMTLLIIAIAPRAGALTDKVGSRWLVGLGMTLLAVMLFYYSQLGASETFWAILPGLLLGGVGMGLTMTPTTAAAMSAVAVDKAGVGSAVLNSARQVGGSLGIAVMGAIVASASDFLTGFHDSLRVGALLCLVGAGVSVLAVRKIEHPHHGHEAPAAVEAA
jgi:predicted MFS family arabinose efflux permease